MKNIIKKSKLYAALFTFAALMTFIISCDDILEDNNNGNYDVKIPESAYSFDVVAFNDGNTTTVYASPEFTDNLDSLNLKVKEVGYYIDNVLVLTATEAPFNLNYSASLSVNDTHSFRAEIIVGGENFNDGHATFSRELKVGKLNETQSDMKVNLFHDHYMHQGDAVNFKVSLSDEKKQGYGMDEVKIYWGENLIATGNTFPYSFSYTPPTASTVADSTYSVKMEYKYHYNQSSSSKITVSSSYSSYVIVLPDTESRYFVEEQRVGNYLIIDNVHYVSQRYVSNGDEISSTIYFYKGKNDSKNYELNIYWDKKLIAHTSGSSPYHFNHPVKNVSKGIHKLIYEWVTYGEDGKQKGKTSNNYTYIVIK